MRPFAIIVMLLAIFSTSAAFAENTGWVRGTEIAKYYGKYRGKLVEKIRCKDGGNKGLAVQTGFFNVTYRDNPEKKKFMWAIGSSYGKYALRAKKKGYVLVSHDQYTRPSGLIVRCGVWHKK